MESVIRVEGFEAFKETAQKYKDKTVFALFSGSKDEKGSSWCPDCVTADPVIESKVRCLPSDAVLIYCGVGDRAFWKDQNNVFRKDPSLKLNCVPTLLRVGKPQRLEESQCANGDLVEMLFTEDD